MVEVSVNWTEIPGSKVRMTRILNMVFQLLGGQSRLWIGYMENLLINPDNCGLVHHTSLYKTSMPRKSI
jgi:hypothetical protein